MAKNELDSVTLCVPIQFLICLFVFIGNMFVVHDNIKTLYTVFIVLYCTFWISFVGSMILVTYRIMAGIPNELFYTSNKYTVQSSILQVLYTIFAVVCVYTLIYGIFQDYKYLYIIPIGCIFNSVVTFFKQIYIEHQIFVDEEYTKKYNTCINNLIISSVDRNEFPIHLKKYRSFINQLSHESPNESNVQESCVICMEDFKDTDNIAVLQCSHLYHYECIISWFTTKLNCPTCRSNIAGEIV